MNVFYIPDGHRRWADAHGCSLGEAYHRGYDVLLEEVIGPLLAHDDVRQVGIFLLSSLNMERRASQDLALLLEKGEVMLANLVEQCRPLASVHTYGSYLSTNLQLSSPSSKRLNLFLGTRTNDDVGCDEATIFMRSGGELRLSGAPRELVGNYTQFYKLDALHPDLKRADVLGCVDAYRHRYMREPH